MNYMRRLLIALCVLALMPLAAQALIQQQRDQIGIGIIINVTPNPLGFAAPPSGASGIAARATLKGAPRSLERIFEAQQLHFTSSNGVLVAQVQKSVKVEASIAPNPLATLLYSDQTAVTLNAEAGIPTHFPCVYHVYVDTTQTSWSLKHGLSFDFSDGAGHSFIGSSVANNTYVATPMPTSTPFVVYNTDGGVWANLSAASGIKTYCVDLDLNMPISTPQGTYSSNAIYTLYY